MLVHSLASKYARFVVIVRQIYWTPPFRLLDPPLLKSDDLFFREPRDIGPPPFKNPGHAPAQQNVCFLLLQCHFCLICKTVVSI